MTKQEALQEQIDDIMDSFEFEDVHNWMKHVGWGWGVPGSTEMEIPDLYEIKRAARQRLKEAAAHGFSSTGGFTAERHEGKDENGPWVTLDLHFGYHTHNDGTSYTE